MPKASPPDDDSLVDNSLVNTLVKNLVNGESVDTVSFKDRGFNYGDGVFETMLVREGDIPFKELHLKRLQLGCERLNIDIEINHIDRQIVSVIEAHAAQLDNPGQSQPTYHLLKLVVTRGIGQRGYKPQTNNNPTIVVSLHKQQSPGDSASGITAMICKHRLGINPKLAGIKHLNRLDNVLASMEVDSERFREGLVFDINDNLIEGISRNVFLVFDNKLLTPLLDQAGVEGVMRQLIIERYARKLGLDVLQDRIRKEQLFSAREVLLCNSIQGVLPVASIDNLEIRQGDVAGALQKHWLNDMCSQIQQ